MEVIKLHVMENKEVIKMRIRMMVILDEGRQEYKMGQTI